MKIAVATNDGTNVSPHFGRSAGFIVFDTEGNVVRNRELRANHHTPHAQGQCGNEPHEHGTHGHNHEGIIGLLGDCQVVLCGGMGAGAAQALQHHGIRTQIAPTPSSVEELLRQFLNGELVTSESEGCKCFP